MLILKLNKGDPITLYDRITHEKLCTISLDLTHPLKQTYLCFDVPNHVVILRNNAKRRLL